MNTLFSVTVFAVAAIWTASVVPADTRECELAKEWVEAHRDALPTTLGAFSEHSMTYRRAIYRALDVEARISLWQQHVATVADQVTLPEQRIFLQRAIPELGSYLTETAPESGLDAFAEEAITVLGEDMARDAFGILGTTPEPTSEDGGARLPDCNCNADPSFSNEFNCDCRTRKWIFFDACKDLESGCGLLWQYECNGLCHQQDPD